MTRSEWRKQFYGVSVTALTRQLKNSKLSQREADLRRLDHCIRKWEGVAKAEENRDNDPILAEYVGDRFNGTGSCALCAEYYDYVCSCPRCPIVRAGEVACPDQSSVYMMNEPDEYDYGTYEGASLAERAAEMVKMLKRVKRFVSRSKP